MIFERKNEMGDINEFEVSSYDITLYRDPLKPHTCKLVVPKNTPFQMFDVITASINDFIPFRGYITNMSIPTRSVGTRILECESIETALNRRYLPPHIWMKTCDSDEILSSDAPTHNEITAKTPLVWWAQSFLPQAAPYNEYQKTGTGYLYGNPYVTIIEGAGYNSRIGEKDIYFWDVKATEFDSFADMPSSGSMAAFVRYEDDIWMVYFGDVGGMTPSGSMSQNFGLAADMAFDVGLRVRSVEISEDLGFHVRTDYDPAWDTIVNIAKKIGLNTHIWYGTDGLTYLDFLETTGRGEGVGQFSYYEDDINVEPLTPSLKKVSALIGRGIGSGPSRHVASQFDLGYRGVWVEELLDIPNGFCGKNTLHGSSEYTPNMQSVVDEQYAIRNADLGYRIKINRDGLIPRITDSINIVHSDGEIITYEVKRINYNSSNPFVLVDIGLTPDDLYDAFTADSGLSTVGGELPYICENPYSDSQNMTFGDADTACSPATFSMTFATGSGYYDNCRILASFSYSLPNCMEYPIGSNPLVDAHAVCWIKVNGINQELWTGGNYILGDSVEYADITELLDLDGTSEAIEFYVVWIGYFTDAPPTVSVSMTLTPVWLE